MQKLLSVMVGLCLSGQGWGQIATPAHPSQYPVGKPNLPCVISAAVKRQIPVDVMLGVQSIEYGATGGAVRNKNNTYDLGAFQINTIHLQRIAQYGGTKYDVMHRGCYNAEVASFLLAEAINHPKKQHEDFYTRAAGYHSWTHTHNQRYKLKLIKYTNEWRIWLLRNGMGHLVQPHIYN